MSSCRKRLTSCATSYPTRLCTVVVALSLMTSLNPSLVDAAVVGATTSRWMYPCAGRMVVEGVGDDVSGLILSSDGGITELTSRAEWSNTLHIMSERTVRLKRKVRELKNLYVQFRFRTDESVQDLEQIGLRLEGMPPVHQPTIAAISNENMISTLHTAFEYLARVAVFVEQARIGEDLAINENETFKKNFEQLEDDRETGIYWLMCALHRIIHASGTLVGREVFDDVMRMRVVQVDRNSWRHTRDYIVLRDFEKLLERLSIDFASLRNVQAIF